MPKVSVIVPVYNSEKYVSACIESIIAQNYSDWELILVDDGSLDKSGQICDRYASHNTKIRVIHLTNSGVSVARNTGIHEAKGDFLVFLDSDDRLNPETLGFCALYSTEYDYIRYSMIKQYANNSHTVHIKETIDKLTYVEELVGRNTILGVCAGCYKRELFTINNISFNPSITNGEDWIVSVQLAMVAKKIMIVDRPFYIYNLENEDSCTSNYSLKKELDKASALHQIQELVGQTIKRNLINTSRIRLMLQGLSACLLHNCKNDNSFRIEAAAITEAYGEPKIIDICKSSLSIVELMKLFMIKFKLGRVILKTRF